ncbi:hypothetical protein KM043_011099 [Ampulex compressa]|nr:hypothetical protein KM043_011099 [Ampulex compressa]
MTGFLCTCNFREKDCVRDAYKLLDEFADELYGSQKEQESETLCDKNDGNNSIEQTEEDISIALDKEINELKEQYEKPVAARRFQAVDTGVKNVIFIRTNLSNPLELVNRIVTELDKTKKQRTRFLLRLLPIEVVCKAYMNHIKAKAEELFEQYFSQEPKTFSIVFNRHSNNNIHRDEVIEDLAEIIARKNPGNKADLKNPEIAVVVEVIRSNCLISIAPNYYKYKKYNLLEICNTNSKQQKGCEKETIAKEDENREESETVNENQRPKAEEDCPEQESKKQQEDETDKNAA